MNATVLSFSLERWFREAVSSGSWRRFDDLHFDDSDPSLDSREKWWAAAPAVFADACALRDRLAPAFRVVLGFAMRPTPEPVAPAWGSTTDFILDLDESPPSLYLFDTKRLAEATSDSVPLRLALLAPLGDNIRYRQAFQPDDAEYVRSVLAIR
jgi:hypothetical protein